MKNIKLLVNRFLKQRKKKTHNTNTRKVHIQTFFKRGHIPTAVDWKDNVAPLAFLSASKT